MTTQNRRHFLTGCITGIASIQTTICDARQRRRCRQELRTDNKTSMLHSEFAENDFYNRVRLLVHTAAKGSGGTDRTMCIYPRFLSADGTAYETRWLEIVPENRSPISFEQGAWDDIWWAEAVPKRIPLIGWTMRIGGRNDRVQKWSYDQLYWYGGRRGEPWVYLGGVNHGDGYKTIDAFGYLPTPRVLMNEHTYYRG